MDGGETKKDIRSSSRTDGKMERDGVGEEDKFWYDRVVEGRLWMGKSSMPWVGQRSK